MKKTLQYHAADNVLVTLDELKVGDTVLVNGEPAGISILDSLPIGHKVAAVDIHEVRGRVTRRAHFACPVPRS